MKNHYLHMLSQSWRYAGRRRPMLVWAYIIFIIGNVVILLEPYFVGKLLITLQLGGEDLFQRSLTWLLILPVLALVYWLCNLAGRVLERTTAFEIRRNCTETMFRKVNELPLKWHRDHHSGETYDKIYKASHAVWRFAEEQSNKIETILRLVVSSIAISIILPFYGLLTLVFTVIIGGVIFGFDRVLERQRQQINRNDHTVTTGLFDYMSNIVTVITLRLSRLVQREISHRITRIWRPTYRANVWLNEAKWFSIGMLVALVTFILLCTYIYQAVASGDTILIGGVAMLSQYIWRYVEAFFNIAWQYEDVVWHSTDFHSADAIMADYDRLVKKQAVKELPTDWQQIAISNLWFRYEDEEHHIHHLDDVALTLKRGQNIALVGESGCGKSTLMRLLRGLQDPDQVTVQIGEKTDTDLRRLADSTTLIPQDPEIFENTIEYNITAGIEHSASDVAEAVQVAQFQAVLDRLPKGLATDIKEKGVNLSGGEKQRLALARGIFAARDSELILLDEPTSSVDSGNERKIHEGLFAHFADRCIVSSIHRLHLLPLFDYIYVLEKGKIIEEGSYDELLAQSGLLTRMLENYNDSSET